MGYQRERYFNQGLRSIPGKYVCFSCFEDYALKQFIRSRSVANSCSYCGRTSSEPIAAEIDDVADLILEGIRYEYEDAVENVGYDSGEGGYLLPTMVTSELLERIFDDEDLGAGLVKDLIYALPDANWVHIDPYDLPEDDRLKTDWDGFCRQVKHETRYMFFRLPIQDAKQIPEDLSAPYEVLFRLGEIIQKIELIKNIPVGFKLFRVRCHSPGETFRTACELGPPPPDCAIHSNRMSPAGIPMFYGALDLRTAIMETYNADDRLSLIITKATFETLKPLRVLDLTSLPECPSLFDAERRHLRTAVSFMQAFALDASKSIARDGREHIEYVPTQVVAEYFRHVYRGEDGGVINGIFYASSQNPGGVDCVLFCDSRNCCDSENQRRMDKDMWLFMKHGSVRRLQADAYITKS